MQCTLNFDSHGDCWRLEGELTIYVVAQIKFALQDTLLTSSTVKLDTSSVSAIDGAGLQLLYWFERFCASKNTPFQLSAPAECLQQMQREFKLQWPGQSLTSVEEQQHVQ